MKNKPFWFFGPFTLHRAERLAVFENEVQECLIKQLLPGSLIVNHKSIPDIFQLKLRESKRVFVHLDLSGVYQELHSRAWPYNASALRRCFCWCMIILSHKCDILPAKKYE